MIVVGEHAHERERLAAAELRRYLYHLTGQAMEIGPYPGDGTDPVLAVGDRNSNAVIAALVEAGALPPEAPAPEGYVIRTATLAGPRPVIAVMGGSPLGTLYGAYRLLEKYGVRFLLSRDVLPPRVPADPDVAADRPDRADSAGRAGQPGAEAVRPAAFVVRDLDLTEQPAVARRGLLPWHDFQGGPSAYSLEDFQRYVNQLVKLRMNTLVLHCYQGGYPGEDINEPFACAARDEDGHARYDAWLDTSVDHQRWGLAASRADDLAFGAGDLLPFDVLGSDAARDVASQPDARDHAYAKAATMLRQVIAYARERGVEVVLGTDFDIVPEALRDELDPLDPAVLTGRVDDILDTYPDLSHVQLYFSEVNEVTTADGAKAYTIVRDHLAKRAPQVRLVTGSWFQEERFPELAAAVPGDVVFSTLMPHDMTVRPEWAQVAADREAWAVPWLEFDGGLSEPQLAVELMERRLPELRATGVHGVIGILWRERAADANVAYLARDLWQAPGTVVPAEGFYRDFAAATLAGTEAASADVADAGAAALSALEAAGVYGFAGGGMKTSEFHGWGFAGEPGASEYAERYARVRTEFERLAALVPGGAEGNDELAYWLAFLRWLESYWTARAIVPGARTWADLHGSGFREAIVAYQDMVRDLPGLGGLVSAAGGRWYFGDPAWPRCVKDPLRSYQDTFVAGLPVAPPIDVIVRSTPDGAALTWKAYPGREDEVAGFHVDRAPEDGSEQFVRLTEEPVKDQTYDDEVSGHYRYRVTAVGAAGSESPPSCVESVQAGDADDAPPPRVLLLPARDQAYADAAFPVSATVLGSRVTSELGAHLRYRIIGERDWHKVAMCPNVRGRARTFVAAMPAWALTERGVEYVVVASDGRHETVAPSGVPRSVTVLPQPDPPVGVPQNVTVTVDDTRARVVTWEPASGPVVAYRIYRGATQGLPPGPDTYLTYVPADCQVFRDATALPHASYSYTVVAVTTHGRTSAVS
ncbi:hypothetical protein [Actinopolymorpha sp. B9G3]